MADASKNYSVSTFSAPTGVWTPVIAPISCSGFSLVGSAALTLASDPNNSATQKALGAGTQEFVPAAKGVRWFPGAVVLWVQPSGGSAVTVTATFVL